MSLEQSVFCSYGGVNRNNLLKVLIQNDIDNIDSSVLFSPYYTPFTILTLNCQSLNAKFDEVMLRLCHTGAINRQLKIVMKFTIRCVCNTAMINLDELLENDP